MRTIIIGDIHGCYRELTALLHKLDFQEEKDTLISLGDLIDRGEYTYEVFDFFRKARVHMKERCIIVRGNHEQMLISSLHDSWMRQMWQQDGGMESRRSFELHNDHILSHLDWFEQNTVLYHESKWFQCVHAGIKNEKPCRNTSETLMWDRSVVLFNNYLGKITIAGHTPMKDPYYFAGVQRDSHKIVDHHLQYLPETGLINIDTGCVSGGRLTAMVIEDYEFFTESVPRGI